MTTTEAIAATIAAHTPIGTRYQLVAVPGTELTDAPHSPFSLAFEQSERELGERIGYPALVYHTTPTDGIQFDADSTIAWLREELDEAHSHIGALVAAIDELDNLGEWIWSEADSATLLSIHLRESHHTELTDLMLAARTWLRREAK